MNLFFYAVGWRRMGKAFAPLRLPASKSYRAHITISEARSRVAVPVIPRTISPYSLSTNSDRTGILIGAMRCSFS